MTVAIPAKRWTAARALMAGFPPTQARIAACMGINASTVAHQASSDNWAVLDFRRADVRAIFAELRQMAVSSSDVDLAAGDADLEPGETDPLDEAAGHSAAVIDDGEGFSPGQRAARLRDMFLAQADALVARLTRAGPIMNRTQLDAINALSRLADRLDMLTAEDAVQKQERSDEQVAEALSRISARIVDLARRLAKKMVEDGARG